MRTQRGVTWLVVVSVWCLAWSAAPAAADGPGRPDAAALAVLRKGQPVMPVPDAKSMAEYLKALAGRAGTEAVQSYVTGKGRETPAPAPAGEGVRPAFEWLAEAITGRPVSFEIDQQGRWAFFEHGDPGRRFSYAAAGGTLCKIDTFYRRESRDRIWTLTRLLFAGNVAKHVVSVGMGLHVLEAVNAAGKALPIAKRGAVPRSWSRHQQEISLPKASFPGGRIAKLRLRASVALRTGATTFVLKTLGHKQPVTQMQAGVTVTVGPLQITKAAAGETWRLPIEARTKYAVPRGMSSLGESVVFRSEDGKNLPRTSWSGSGSGNRRRITVSITPHSIDPGSTQLVLEYPTGLKVVPVDLTFRDVAIRDVTPRPKR